MIKLLTNKSYSAGPYIIFISKIPPGLRFLSQKSRIIWLSLIDFIWSINLSPTKSGTASDKIISAL